MLNIFRRIAASRSRAAVALLLLWSAVLATMLVGCGGNPLASSTSSGLVVAWLFVASLVGTLVGCGGGSTNNGTFEVGANPAATTTNPPATAVTPTPTPNAVPTPTPSPTPVPVQVPVKLVFQQLPGQKNTNANVQAASPLPTFTVAILDADGKVVTGATNAVTVSLGAGSPANATLSGTLTVNAVNGIATFTNVILSPSGSAFTLVASASGLTSAQSTAFDVNPLNAMYPGSHDMPVGLAQIAAIWSATPYSSLQRVLAAKLTASGHDDLIVIDTTFNQIHVYLGNGDGTFQAPLNYATGSWPGGAAVADLNGDGRPDIVVGNHNQTVANVLLGNGDGTFQPPQTVQSRVVSTEVIAADFGTGHADVILADRINGFDFGASGYAVAQLHGNGDGTFATPNIVYSTPNHTRAIATARLTSSGFLDLIVAEDGKVSMLAGNGDGTFKAPVVLATPASPVSVQAGPLAQSNGLPSVVYEDATGHGVVLVGNGDGTFKAAINLPIPSSTARGVLGDVTGDGIPDLALVSSSMPGTMSILAGVGDGTFQAATNAPLSGAGQDVTLGDFDSDGILDVTSINGTPASPQFTRPLLANLVSLFLSSSRNSATTMSSGLVNIRKTVGVDVNGDGNIDLVSTDYTRNIVAVNPGNADGTFAAPINTQLTATPGGVTAKDFNGDGHPDLVVVYPNAPVASVLLGNGDGTFKAPVNYALPGSALNVTTGDVNGDNTTDIVTANYGASTSANVSYSILMGNGDGTFKSALNTGLGRPRDVVVADLNNDGHADIAAVNQYNLTVMNITNGVTAAKSLSILAGNGDGTFQAQVNYDVAASPFTLGAADLNGDGFVDLVAPSHQTGEVTVMLNNGDGTFKLGSLLLSGFDAQGEAFADVNLDGIPDLVVANYQSNNVAVFIGNGDGTFAAPVTRGGSHGLSSVIVADVNHDGKPDIVGTGNGSSIDEFLHL